MPASQMPAPTEPAQPEQSVQTDLDAAAAGDQQGVDDTLQALSSDPNQQISWTASEYIAHQKSFGWYAVLSLVALGATGITYLVTEDKLSTATILLIAFVFGVYGARKPRVLNYQLDANGLTIARKFYAYGIFRSFAVLDEGAFSSIVFMPLKRFMPLLAVYYAPDDEDKIVQMLMDRLPMEERKHDAIDSLMHKIRF
jgi:hypothetical protein